MTVATEDPGATAESEEAVHLQPALQPEVTPLCELRAASVSYGTQLANDAVSLCVRPGEVVALLGENGAGKSTLLHSLYGLVPLSLGEVRYGGKPLQASPERAIAHGIGLISQHFLLVPRLTVAENVALGCEPRRAGKLSRLLGLYDRRWAEEEVAELGRRYGLMVDPRRRVSELSVGEAQRVEILKTLYRGARCLLLDEPTAVLTPGEARRLLGVLRGLVLDSADPAEKRRGLLIVTHKLDEVIEVADRAVVLRAGRVVAQYPRAAFSARAMAHALVGRELLPVTRETTASGVSFASAPALWVRNLSVTEGEVERVRGVSFELRPGSILGLAGVEGNGQSELCAALVGLLRPSAGQVLLCGQDVTTASVKARRISGLSFVLEDRQRHGLVLDFSLAENLLLGEEERYRRGRFAPLRWIIARRRLLQDARELLAAHDVRPPDPAILARALSGGNQQKLLLARALGRPDQIGRIGQFGQLGRLPRVLIVAQPTRGVDLGAVFSIHQALLKARDHGCAILLVSTELDELRTLCDHIAVLYRGQVRAELENPATAPVSRERLGELLAGVG
jgi:simple sugar transport system ATP-binding protein